MKRSKLLQLSLMGALPFILTACDDQVSTPFANADVCVKAGHPEQLCQNAFNTAFNRDKTNPLLYADREACGKDWDANTCAPASESDKHYRPQMQGMAILWTDDTKKVAEAVTPLYKLRDGGYGDARQADFLDTYGSDAPGIQPASYDNIQDCVDDGNSQSACQTAYDAAAKDIENAPSYADENSCENNYDRCHRDSSGSWIPFMVGYMMGSSNGSSYSHPVYTSRAGDYVTSVRGSSGTHSVSISSTSSRGVFGSSAAARGSWGGSGYGG